jgi:hypothetical protein
MPGWGVTPTCSGLRSILSGALYAANIKVITCWMTVHCAFALTKFFLPKRLDRRVEFEKKEVSENQVIKSIIYMR